METPINYETTKSKSTFPDPAVSGEWICWDPETTVLVPMRMLSVIDLITKTTSLKGVRLSFPDRAYKEWNNIDENALSQIVSNSTVIALLAVTASIRKKRIIFQLKSLNVFTTETSK